MIMTSTVEAETFDQNFIGNDHSWKFMNNGGRESVNCLIYYFIAVVYFYAMYCIQIYIKSAVL